MSDVEELCGVITSIEDGEFGFIDGNVFFTKSVCQTMPKVNDRVKYTAKSREGSE